jgi:hypothetical protein
MTKFGMRFAMNGCGCAAHRGPAFVAYSLRSRFGVAGTTAERAYVKRMTIDETRIATERTTVWHKRHLWMRPQNNSILASLVGDV